MDAYTEKKRRKFELFRNLMQTRGIRLDPIHVAALNIIELELYSNKNVRSAFHRYIEHLSAPMPSVEEQDRFFSQRSDLFMDLLHEIGNVVGYRFDRRELERRSYVPVGWDNDQTLVRRNAQLVNQLLTGERPLPVTNFIARPNPFPEPPQAEDQ
jgi:hypothetical protein